MVRACHLIWTTYGWWLPNDPRGSWSQEVWQPTIRGLGDRHLGRRPKQPTPSALRRWLDCAQHSLKHEPVVLDGTAAREAVRGIGEQVERHRYTILALAVLPDHAHVVVRRHAHQHTRIVAGLKAVSSRRVRQHLGAEGGTPVWARGYWVRFLDEDNHIRAAVRYVDRNPVRMGLRAQRWPFVIPF